MSNKHAWPLNILLLSQHTRIETTWQTFCLHFQIHFRLWKYIFFTPPAVNIAVHEIDIQRIRYYSRDGVRIVWSLWRHQKSIVTSSVECKPSEWDTGSMCEDHGIYHHLWICVRNGIIYVCTLVTNCFCTRVLYRCLFPDSQLGKWTPN